MNETVPSSKEPHGTPGPQEIVVSTADLADPSRSVGVAATPARVSLEYPITVLHQVWVSELRTEPEGSPRDGIELPQWLFEKAGLRFGEQVTLTREHGDDRKVEAKDNRTITAVFPWSEAHVRASGPTAMFLGGPGLSCLIAYGKSESLAYPLRGMPDATMVDLSFPCHNRTNRESDLAIRFDHRTTRHDALETGERQILLAQISGLCVQEAADHCNPLLALIPLHLMARAGLGDAIVGAYFSSQSKGMPALHSYAVGTADNRIASSGALAGAFPKGERFVVNVFGAIAEPSAWRPRRVHLAS